MATSVISPNRPSGAILSYSNIYGLRHDEAGTFKMSHDLFGWKGRKSGTVHQYKATDVLDAQFCKIGPNSYDLKVKVTKEGQNLPIHFRGFQEKSSREIAHLFEEFLKRPVKRSVIASRGWHWGDYEVEENEFRFVVDNKPAFQLDINEMSQVSNPTKSDLSIEFQQDEKEDSGHDNLLEIRFYKPPTNDANETELHVENLKKQLIEKSRASLIKVDSLTRLNDVHLLVPRGRYEIDMSKDSMKLHGKSYDYVIQYQNIQRMFLVPRPNSPHMAFVMGLTVAMRQGQTRYPYVVMQFDTDTEMSLSLNMESEELANLQLEKELEGQPHDIVTRLFKALVGRNIVVPGEFKNINDQHGITCSYRAGSGHLYPLNRSFLFIVKPVIFIRHEDIVIVEFSRAGPISQNRFFSLTISLKGGTEYEFTSIDRNEYNNLLSYLQSKSIRIKNAGKVDDRPSSLAADLPSEEEDSGDEDFNADEDDSDAADYNDDEGSDENASDDDDASVVTESSSDEALTKKAKQK